MITSGFIFFVVSSPLLDPDTRNIPLHLGNKVFKTFFSVLKNVFKTRPIVKRFSKTIENIGGVSEKNFLFEQWILKFHKFKSQHYNHPIEVALNAYTAYWTNHVCVNAFKIYLSQSKTPSILDFIVYYLQPTNFTK